MTTLTQTEATTVARAVAADNGLALDGDALAAAVARLTVDLALDESRSLTFGIDVPFHFEHGQVIDRKPLDHALGIVREHGKPVAPTVPAPGSPAPAPTRPKAGAAVSDFGKAFAAMEDAATVRETETWPNPFIAGSNFNRTRQQILINKNPVRAAQFKAQAGD